VLPGETLGSSASPVGGKTTVGRAVLRLDEPTDGVIRFGGTDITHAGQAPICAGIPAQDPGDLPGPLFVAQSRMTVGQIIGEPLRFYKLVRNRNAEQDRVGRVAEPGRPVPYMAERYPHELSGGQPARRHCAAAALEPTFIGGATNRSPRWDVSIQGQIINLLEDLQARLKLSYLFIAHDLRWCATSPIAWRVMYLGRVGSNCRARRALWRPPQHPYTKALCDAAPVPDPRSRHPRAAGAPRRNPLTLDPAVRLLFHTRCPIVGEECGGRCPSSAR